MGTECRWRTQEIAGTAVTGPPSAICPFEKPNVSTSDEFLKGVRAKHGKTRTKMSNTLLTSMKVTTPCKVQPWT